MLDWEQLWLWLTDDFRFMVIESDIMADYAVYFIFFYGRNQNFKNGGIN